MRQAAPLTNGFSTQRRHSKGLLQTEKARVLDVLMVTRIDRLARSIGDLQDIVRAVKAKGASLKATEQPIDTTSAAGKAFLDMLGVFAEFETNLRKERQTEGIAKAKAAGVYKGRLPSIDVAKVRDLKKKGLGASEIAKALKIGRASVYPLMRGKYGRLFGKAAVRHFVFAALAISCAGCESVIPEPKTSDAQQLTVAPAQGEMRDLTAAERSILADGFASSLNEPESAKFRWAKVPKLSVGPSFEYCGMVNVKNSKGVYDGMQAFLATIATANGNITGGAIAAINSGNREENREVVPRLCRQKGLNPSEAK
jgi:Resolvase, N terminal domain